MSGELAIQAGLFSALSTTPALVAAGVQVHDSAPQRADGGSLAAFPYVEVGAVVITMGDTFERTGFAFLARIHTRSRSPGMKECKVIQGAIYDRLHRGGLSLTGYRLIDLQRQMSDVTRVQDGSFHGVCEYRGLIEKT